MAAKKKKQEYMGNPNLPTANAVFEYTPEMVVEITKCKEDIFYYYLIKNDY
jgi:hypothetical protein